MSSPRGTGAHSAVVAALELQARACADYGSPFYAGVLARAAAAVTAPEAADATTGRLLVELLTSTGSTDLLADAVVLRLLGGVHRLVLERAAPRLAMHWPSVGGDGDPDRAWQALRLVLPEHAEELARSMGTPPQTNEVGRGAALLGLAHRVGCAFGLPLRLAEIGASAGLNLLADRFAVSQVSAPAHWIGPDDALVRLGSSWDGPLPALCDTLTVIERVGCDLQPVDVSTTAGRLLLSSYVWPDDRARWERLRAAMATAQRYPVTVVASSAAEFVASLSLRPGSTLLLWHSVMWQYLPSAEQDAVQHAIEQLGAAATADAPFCVAALEPRTRDGAVRFEVSLACWPATGPGLLAGQRQVLAESAPHGVPTLWF